MKRRMFILCLVIITSVFTMSLWAQFDFNFGGELKMRNRINFEDEGSSPGFSFYELELFIDGDITDYSSFYIEYNLMHSNKPDPENVWIDLHAPMRPAFARGGMGLRIGHFQVPFGYENDDNEGYMYQGRAGVNHSLIHGEKIDGWKLRERQLGICGAYSFGPLTTWVGVYNGNGSWLASGGSDNASMDYDYAFKAEIEVANFEIGGSYWLAPGVDNTADDYNGKGILHTRDITYSGVHFKWPASALFVAQDAALGGEPFLIFGEYIMGEHKENDWDQSFGGDQEVMGTYIETEFGIIPETLVGWVRFDYYEPNKDVDDDETIAITPGINWFFWTSMRFILEYEYYDNKTENTLAKQDRIAAEISITF